MHKQVCFFEDENSYHSQENTADNCSCQVSPEIEIEGNKHDRQD